MRSVIFSLVSGIALTLLLRSPAPAPPPPQPCASQAAALQDPAAALPPQLIDALRDSFPAWLAGLEVPGAAVVIVGDGRMMPSRFTQRRAARDAVAPPPREVVARGPRPAKTR